MANPNEVLGFLHAFYGLGAVLAPLIATTMITKGNKLPWYYFYYVMVHLPSPQTLNSTSKISNIHRSQWPQSNSPLLQPPSTTPPVPSSARSIRHLPARLRRRRSRARRLDRQVHARGAQGRGFCKRHDGDRVLDGDHGGEDCVGVCDAKIGGEVGYCCQFFPFLVHGELANV
jgi:hypothetical protein